MAKQLRSELNQKTRSVVKIKSDVEKWEDLAVEYIKYARGEKYLKDPLRFNVLTPEILNIIGNVRGKKVIDAGCGEGYLSRTLSREGGKVIGIDVSKTMIREALLQERYEDLGTKYILCDLTDPIPIESGSVDIIVANMVFFSIREIEKVIKNLSGYLSKDGEFIFSILHPCFHLNNYQWENIHLLNTRNGVLSTSISESYHDERLIERPYIDSFHKISVYLRSIEFYLQLFLKNGYTISDFREPILRLDNEKGGGRYYHAHFIPRFLIVKCKKTSGKITGL